MKTSKTPFVVVGLVIVAILVASYFDKKDQDAALLDEEIRQAEFEKMQPPNIVPAKMPEKEPGEDGRKAHVAATVNEALSQNPEIPIRIALACYSEAQYRRADDAIAYVEGESDLPVEGPKVTWAETKFSPAEGRRLHREIALAYAKAMYALVVSPPDYGARCKEPFLPLDNPSTIAGQVQQALASADLGLDALGLGDEKEFRAAVLKSYRFRFENMRAHMKAYGFSDSLDIFYFFAKEGVDVWKFTPEEMGLTPDESRQLARL